MDFFFLFDRQEARNFIETEKNQESTPRSIGSKPGEATGLYKKERRGKGQKKTNHPLRKLTPSGRHAQI